MKLHQQKGFTLLEIVVVLIILGVLASIALPSLFSNVRRSRTTEAVTSLTTYKQQLEGCIRVHLGSQAVNCSSTANFVATDNFTYVWDAGGGQPNSSATADGVGYRLRAESRNLNNLVTGTDYIVLSRISTTVPASFRCLGYGALAGAC